MDVFWIPELADRIFGEMCIVDLVKTVAAARMVCRTMRDAFATKITTEITVRSRIEYTTTVYSVLFLSAQEPYRTGGEKLGFIEKLWCGEDESAAINKATTIHARFVGGRMVYTGFRLSGDEFIAINRLFGLKAANYGKVLTEKSRQSGRMIEVGYVIGEGVLVKGDNRSRHFLQDPRVGMQIGAYYMFCGRIYCYESDIGHYSNVRRLKILDW